MKTIMMAILLALQTADQELARIEEWAKTQPENGAGKVGIGDEYFKAGKKFPKERARFMEKANEWWAKGWPELDPVWKDKTRENLRKIYFGSPATKAAAEWKGDRPMASGERVRSGVFAAKMVMPKGTKENEGSYYQPFKWEAPLPKDAKEVVVSLWVLTDGTSSAIDEVKPTLTRPDGTLSYAFATALPMDLPVWTKIEIKVEVKGATKVHVGFSFQSRAGVVFVDDVSVKADGKELLLNGGFER